MARSCVLVAIVVGALAGADDCAALAQGPGLAAASAMISPTKGAPAPCAPAASSSELILSPTQAAGPEGVVQFSSATISDLDEPQSSSDVPGFRPTGLKTDMADANGSTPIEPGPVGQGPVGQGPAGPGPAGPGPGGSNSVGNLEGDSGSWEGQWFFGGDFLYVRSHFSQATAFVEGSQTASTYHVSAEALDLQYTPSFRVFAGYRIEGTDTELKFTYTRFTADTQSDAGNFSAGHFAVDPFGNVVGTAVVVDPSSAEFGHAIVGGDHIQATADVHVNIFDLDLIKPLMWVCGGCELKYNAGVRIADVDQSYQSTILKSGAFFSGGDYTGDFTGAGPRIGLQAQRYFGSCRQFSIFANAAGSLIVGDFNSHFDQRTTAPVFQASQDTEQIRLIPVAETEIGAGWSPLPWCNLSAGWLFQAWFDLGASGGTYGGFYTVTQNANLMAFDGLFARFELSF
jgi:hypothetical protein